MGTTMVGISTSMPGAKSRRGRLKTESARKVLRANVRLLERLFINANPTVQRTVGFGVPMECREAESSLSRLVVDRIRDRARDE